MRRYKFLDKTNPHFIEAIVHERSGTLAKVPGFWWNKDVYIYFSDGNIEKKRTITNSSSLTHVRIPIGYKNQKVQIRLAEKVECENLKKYL